MILELSVPPVAVTACSITWPTEYASATSALTPITGDVPPDHLPPRRVVVPGKPAVGHHHPVGVAQPDRGGERAALVRPGGRDEQPRRVMPLLERLHEGADGRDVGGSEHDE